MAWQTTSLNLKGPKGDTGDTGPAGQSVVIEGSVSSASQLPATATKGHGYIAQDTGHLHVWDGAEWDDVGQVKGPPGADGRSVAGAVVTPSGDLTFTFSDQTTSATWNIRGPKGDTGTAGSTGATGQRGTRWYTGQGAPGAQTGQLAGDLYLDLNTGNVWTFS